MQLEQGKVWKGAHFTVTITYPTRWSAEIEAALWAWETFGGLGARTRRGFGALHLLEINGEPPRTLPTSRGIEAWIREHARHHIREGQFPVGVPHLSPEIAVVVTNFNRDPVEVWKNLIKKLQEFRQQKDMSKRSAWPEADAIRAIARTGPTADIPKFPRAAFGLPVIFHFIGKNAPAGNYTLNEADTKHEPDPGKPHLHKERFASPLILRPFQCSDGMSVGLALLLEGSRVDLNHLVVQDERKRSQPVEGTLTTQEARTITLLLEGQQETWSTETRPSEKEPLPREWIFNEQGEKHTAVIEVATTRSTKQGVDATLPKIGLTPEYHIRFTSSEFSRESVRDAAHARAIARQVGQVCQNLCDERGVRHLHLFVAIPVELAVLIGHQLNALCPITLYEFKNYERVYTPIGMLHS